MAIAVLSLMCWPAVKNLCVLGHLLLVPPPRGHVIIMVCVCYEWVLMICSRKNVCLLVTDKQLAFWKGPDFWCILNRF